LTTTFPHEEKANAAVIAALRSPPPTDTTFTPTGWHANIQYLLSRKDSEELIRRFAWNAPEHFVTGLVSTARYACQLDLSGTKDTMLALHSFFQGFKQCPDSYDTIPAGWV